MHTQHIQKPARRLLRSTLQGYEDGKTDKNYRILIQILSVLSTFLDWDQQMVHCTRGGYNCMRTIHCRKEVIAFFKTGRRYLNMQPVFAYEQLIYLRFEVADMREIVLKSVFQASVI